MLIVDAQVHIWKSGTPVSIHRQIPSYTKDDLLKEMDEGGVDAAILHPPSWDSNGNEIAVEAASEHPDVERSKLSPVRNVSLSSRAQQRKYECIRSLPTQAA